MNLKKLLFLSLIGTSLIPLRAESDRPDSRPIVLKTMGSLFFGGTVLTLPNGETFHGDHGYAQYFIPAKARNYPLILWHGMGQSGRSFESRPDVYGAASAKQLGALYRRSAPARPGGTHDGAAL